MLAGHPALLFRLFELFEPLALAETDSRAAAVVVADKMILDRFDHIFRLRDRRLETGATGGLKLESATVS